ncbi:hypothetical protein ACI6Q2_18055 [Chitinophagaceae bacterium LWZ2-11]
MNKKRYVNQTLDKLLNTTPFPIEAYTVEMDALYMYGISFYYNVKKKFFYDRMEEDGIKIEVKLVQPISAKGVNPLKVRDELNKWLNNYSILYKDAIIKDIKVSEFSKEVRFQGL